MIDRRDRTLVLAVTAISVLAVLLAAFVWPGPNGQPLRLGGRGLYDEALVEKLYQRVSPAVVQVYSDRRSGDSYSQGTSGSGFLIDHEGHIVTNDHVIRKADRVRVSFSNHHSADAQILGRSPANDLALLQVDPTLVEDITPLELGNSSQVHPGQMSIIVGSPFGLQNSISVGVTSAVDRSLPSALGRFIPGMLQTDALISPGNSGGPMLNRYGQVIGVTTAIELSTDRVSQHIGFAVPINTLRELLPQLKRPEIVRPPWLGTLSECLNPLLVERLGLSVEWGFYVIEVVPGSPAAEAGLTASGIDNKGRPAVGGDIIVAVDGVSVVTGADLTSQLNRGHPGRTIPLTVVRDGTELTIDVTLDEWPSL